MNNEELTRELMLLKKKVEQLESVALKRNMDRQAIAYLFNEYDAEQKLKLKNMLTAIGYTYP